MTVPATPVTVSPTPTFPPDRKVWSGGLAGILTWLIIFGLGKAGVPLDPTLQSGLALVVGYAVSYFVPPSLRDVVSRVNNDIVKIANADQSNPTTAVVVRPAAALEAAKADVASGAIPVQIVTPKL